MKRRNAIKNMAIGLGYVVSVPSMMGVLKSCTFEPDLNYSFFSYQEGEIVKKFTEVFLPKTDDAPGGSELNLHQFIDIYVADCFTKKQRQVYKSGLEMLNSIYQTRLKKNPVKMTVKECEPIVSEYLNISEKDYQNIKLKIEKVLKGEYAHKDLNSQDMIVNAIVTTKDLAVFAYLNHEYIGEKVLPYDPNPGSYDACISLEEATGGLRWSL